jgi:1-acyl-sn-glycerol-3-phosphate acyltransferase
MSLIIIDLLLSLGISAYCTYLVCIHTAWYYFWVGLFMVIPCYALIFGLFVIFLAIWGKFLNTKKEVKKPNRFYYWFVKNVDTWTLSILRVHTKVIGKEKLPKEPYLLIDNHISDFDQMVLISKINDAPLICVSKPENMKFPIAGPFIHHAGFIPINRDDPRKAISAIKQAISYLTDDKVHVCIAPEGTRNKTDQPMLPFHPGSFKIAYLAKCPIVVCCLKNTKNVKKNTPWKPTHVEMNILKVLTYDDYKDMSTHEVAEYTHDLILKEYTKNHTLLQ